jgi:hypothetical protein
MVQSDPSGRDGSLLAEIRDLRCYLLLVEAEMVSRGVVKDRDYGMYKYKPGTPEDGGHHEKDNANG